MKLEDLRKKYYKSTRSLSQVNRKLALAGIVIVWFFANPKILTSCPLMKLGKYFLPFSLFASSLALDLLQYTWASVIYGYYHRKMEKKGVNAHGIFEIPSWINRPSIIIIILKVSCTIFAYLALAVITI